MVGQHAHLGKLPGQGHRARSEMRGARAGDGYLLFPLRDCCPKAKATVCGFS